ncbi:MAG: hypothetical protein RBT34_13495, partial [Anaerolineaceae bacterium]|nr:hypothetical protein [Anaerolineaceae bacterium]
MSELTLAFFINQECDGMIYLLVVSLVWAFSFGLIKGNLVGLDAVFVAGMRLLISLLVFLPML